MRKWRTSCSRSCLKASHEAKRSAPNELVLGKAKTCHGLRKFRFRKHPIERVALNLPVNHVNSVEKCCLPGVIVEEKVLAPANGRKLLKARVGQIWHQAQPHHSVKVLESSRIQVFHRAYLNGGVPILSDHRFNPLTGIGAGSFRNIECAISLNRRRRL